MLNQFMLAVLDDLTEDIPTEALSDCLTARLKGLSGLDTETPLDLP